MLRILSSFIHSQLIQAPEIEECVLRNSFLIYQQKHMLWAPKHMRRNVRFRTMWYVRDQPAHTRSPTRAFASRLNIQRLFSY